MRTLKTVAVITTLAVVVIGALALVMAGRGWWNAGSGTEETATPTTVTVTAEPETEETTEVTETEDPETTEETEVTETEEPESTEAAAPEDTDDLGLKRDRETVADLSGQERTAVRGVLRACMDEIGAIHYVSQIKACLAGDATDWSEDSARRSGEVAY